MDDLTSDQIISESDFSTITPSGNFIQLQYHEDESRLEPYKVKPGIWAIVKTMEGLKLKPTSFTQDRVLSSFVNTKSVTEKIDCFFDKINVYYELGFEVPKRAALLYGPPGSGKSTIITLVTDKYVKDNKTAIIVWHTDKFEAHQVKDFIKSFEYVDGVEKLVLIAEDIGGIEIDNARMRSDSSLLSLLDNQEKTFKIPVFILATTNFPHIFMANLTNRPNRFDDKIEVGFPEGPYRQELLKFFSGASISEDAINLMGENLTKDFSPAHIREVVIRSKIYDKSLVDVIKEISEEIRLYKNDFEKKNSRMGLMSDDY